MNSPTSSYEDFVTVTVQNQDAELPPVQETIRYDQFVKWLFKADTEPMMALHAALGVCGEVGELIEADLLGTEAGVIEECGDLEFYLQAVRNHYNIRRTPDQASFGNITVATIAEPAAKLAIAAGELADVIKREYIYGKPRELRAVFEALAKIEVLLRIYRPTSRINILQANAVKLSKRYSSLRYSDAAAIQRADKQAPNNQN